MKTNYDFSNAKRGKFYRSDAKLNIPVYLDEKNLEFVSKIARRKEKDISTVVNQIIKSDMHLAEVIK
jgi:xanthine dehydrogenase iron-sulfur cluster and FAD-binding subunit A